MSSAPQSQGEEVGVAAEAAPPAPLDPQAEYAELIGAFRAHLLWLRDGGVAGIPRSAPGTVRQAPLPAARPQPPRPEPPGREDRQDRYAPAPPPVAAAPPPEMRALFEAARAEPTGRPPPSRSASRALAVYPELPDPLPQRGAAGLDFVRDVIGECTRCKLCHGRNSLVFGQGAPAPPVVFVGEGPGAEEDRTGLPFVGAAGDLLTRMIGAMGLSRDDVYIANVVKCRPPGNRTPEPDEVAACGPFLRAQLQALAPRVIIALGRTPAQFLMGNTAPITRIRGTWHRFEGVPLMPTFHPAYLLRTPSAKRDVWEDLKQVMAKLKEPPEGGP